jgi:hypothetical protein
MDQSGGSLRTIRHSLSTLGWPSLFVTLTLSPLALSSLPHALAESPQFLILFTIATGLVWCRPPLPQREESDGLV